MAFTAGSFYQQEKFIESDPWPGNLMADKSSATFITTHLRLIPRNPAHWRKVFLLNIENVK